MKLEYYSAQELKKQILAIIGKYLDLNSYRVYFFGSRVKEDSFLRSDIDIGIEGSEAISAKIKLQIEEELDNLPTLYKFDLVDFKKVSSEFKREALKHVEYVN